MTPEAAFDRYRETLVALDAETLSNLGHIMDPSIRFKDSFHEVTGLDQVKRIFADLFQTAEDIRFVIDDASLLDDGAYFRWLMTARLSGKPWRVEGVTRVVFNSEGKAVEHVEYWDAASQFYERLPVIGGILRLIRKRIARP